MILNKRFFCYILVYFINLSLTFSNQEKGSLSGVVTDEKNGQPLIGANVIISGTSIGSATDINGRYIIKNLDIGMIDLVVTYIGYKKKTVKGIDISSLKSFEKNIMMDQDVISVMEVKVQAEKRESGDASALQKKQEAIEMQDNISADQISKSGDSHVADAVRRVTGVTIVSDKYLVVRGLGDRYSSAQLNSVGMPSPEADKRSVPLDLFSTALISGIDVAKSYRPDLPGAFGGGNVNIRTKLYPSKTIYKIKFGSGLSSNLTPGSNAFQNFQKNIKGNSDFIGYDFNKSRDIPEFFDNELISYNSIPDEFMPELRDTTYTQFGTQIISSDPMREYLWAEQSYNKNARLKNTFKNSVETSGLPRNLSMTYGTKYQAGRDLEMGFLVDGNFSGKYTYNTERMDRYVAYNDTSSYIDKEDESGEIVRTYDKLLRPGFIGLDRDIYQYATNLGFNFSYGITFRKNLRFGIRNVYTHTSKDNFTKAEGLSGELTYDYKTLYPGIDFDKNIETDNIYKGFNGEEWTDENGDGLYNIQENFVDLNGDGVWNPGDSIRVLDESGLLISQRYNEKAINLTTLSIENKFPLLSFNNEIDFKFTFGNSDMYEPFANKSEWEYVRNLNDPRTGAYTLYLRNGSNPGVSYVSRGEEEIEGLSFDHKIKSVFGDLKYGIKVDRKERDFKRRYLYLDYSDFTLANNDSVTTSGLTNYNEVLSEPYWASINSDSTIHEGLFFNEKTSGFDGYIASENIDAAYIMYNYNWINKFQLSVGGRWENYRMKMDPYHPVLKYKPYILTTNGVWDEGEILDDLNGNGVWDEGETFEDNASDTSVIKFNNSAEHFLPALTLNYSLSNKVKIRSSYSRTVARAQFREYAPYVFQEFLGADETVGYPFLKNSTIESADIRYEYFPKGVELVSLGFFTKRFTNPIEESLIAASGLSSTKSWQNGKYANIAGLETEIRKSLDIIPSNIGFLFLNTNLALSRSEVLLPDSVYVYVVRSENTEQVAFPNSVDNDGNKVSTRPLQGQSDIVFNASLNFKSQKGYDLNLTYNSFSKRLIRISNEVAGHFWERPFHSLNFVANKKIKSIKLSFKASNILNNQVRLAHFYSGEYYNTRTYNPGQNFSFSIQYNN